MVEVDPAMSGTAAGLMLFLAWAGERGEMPANTANGLRATAKAVLASEDPDLDMRTADLDSIFTRFVNLNKTSYGDASLATYRSRFKRAVNMYSAWLAHDPGWKGAGRTSGSAPERRTAGPNGGTRVAKVKRKTVMTPASEPPEDGEPSRPEVASPRLVPYDVPLRPDLLVRLNLPMDLTMRDASRLAAFIKTLAFDEQEPSRPSRVGTPSEGD